MMQDTAVVATRPRISISPRLLIPLLVAALLGSVAWRFGNTADTSASTVVPQSSAMEATLGVRFSLAAVVGGGGIVQLSYTVLDPTKAAAFQNDVRHPPVLRSEQGGTRLSRTALMKQAHTLRPGQTYYILYLDSSGAVRRGGTLEIETGGRRLAHVPVR